MGHSLWSVSRNVRRAVRASSPPKQFPIVAVGVLLLSGNLRSAATKNSSRERYPDPFVYPRAILSVTSRGHPHAVVLFFEARGKSEGTTCHYNLTHDVWEESQHTPVTVSCCLNSSENMCMPVEMGPLAAFD